MAFNTQAQANAEKLLFQNKYTALPSENSDDNTQYFKNQYGEQHSYDPDANRYIRSETNEGDQQYTAGSREYLASLYSKYGLDPSMMRGGEEMSRPTEINGGLYVPVRSGYFDPNAGYDNFSPAIKAARAAALKNVYIDSEGNTFAKPQDVEKTNKMIAPYLPPKYDFFNKYGVGLVSAAVLGPAIAGAAGGAGVGAAASADAIGLAQMGQAAGLSGSALSEFVASGGTLGSTAAGAGGAVAASMPQSYWSMLANSSNVGAPSAAAGTIGSNLSPATAAWMQSAGYTADQIASIGSQFGTNGVLNGLALDAGYNVADAFRPDSSFNPDVQFTPYERMYDSMSTQDLGQTVKPFTTNPSFADLGGTAGAAAGATGIAGLLQQLSTLTGLPTSAIERLGGAGISSLASMYGASKLGQASMDAANRVAAANQSATQLQSQMYQDQVARQQPFYQAGLNALPSYTKGVMPGGDLVRPFAATDFQADPGYGFRMSEGLKALDRSAASRGNLLSGATLKGAQRFGQDIASNEYNNAYNRYVGNQATQRNALAGLTGFAPTAAQQIGNAGSNYATNAGNLGINTATTYGNADMTGAAARQSAYMGAGGAFANALSPNPLNAYLNKQLGIA